MEHDDVELFLPNLTRLFPVFSSHLNVELEREYFQVVIFHLLSRSFRMLGMLEGFRLV